MNPETITETEVERSRRLADRQRQEWLKDDPHRCTGRSTRSLAQASTYAAQGGRVLFVSKTVCLCDDRMTDLLRRIGRGLHDHVRARHTRARWSNGTIDFISSKQYRSMCVETLTTYTHVIVDHDAGISGPIFVG